MKYQVIMDGAVVFESLSYLKAKRKCAQLASINVDKNIGIRQVAR